MNLTIKTCTSSLVRMRAAGPARARMAEAPARQVYQRRWSPGQPAVSLLRHGKRAGHRQGLLALRRTRPLVFARWCLMCA
jgi:hypothetical protein